VSVLAIVPARGGSKGIPRKNLALLAGRPLIAYTLDAARTANCVTDILISTEDDEIAAACEAEGVHVRYRRPAALAGDGVGMVETTLHALNWWEAERGSAPDVIMLLQPTSPLRGAKHIDGTLAALSNARRNSAISVTEMTEHPMECARVAGGSWARLERPTAGAQRRQDYAARFYFINGAVYASTPAFLRSHRAFMVEGDETALYLMDPICGIDIDDPVDLELAEAILAHPGLNQRIRASSLEASTAAT
jgi:N-acylneuraminate cytidylyltransferase/CMP-N,N'-diacetyllegionaminic acid synthase